MSVSKSRVYKFELMHFGIFFAILKRRAVFTHIASNNLAHNNNNNNWCHYRQISKARYLNQIGTEKSRSVHL